MEVASALRESILRGEWSNGQRLPPEAELCQRFSVARNTLRAAMDELQHQGLISLISGNGRKSKGRVVNAAGPRRGLLSETIVLLTALSDPQAIVASTHTSAWDDVIDASAGAAVRRTGFHLMALNPSQLSDHDKQELLRSVPCGVLATDYAAQAFAFRETLGALAGQGVPVVVGGGRSNNDSFDRVFSDHADGAFQLAAWLTGQGRRRICEVGVSPDDEYWVTARSQGYRKAMTEAGLAVLPRVRVRDVRQLDGERETFEIAARQYAGFLAEHCLGPDPIDAVMAQNDYDAAQISHALRLLGLRPQHDVAVVGYDNSWNHYPRQWEDAPPLATVDKNNEQVGQTMVQLLVARINGEVVGEPLSRAIRPRLVVQSDPASA